MNSSSQIDERTPLLDRLDDEPLPAISPVLARVSVSPGQGIPTDDLLPYPLTDQSTEMAFTLAVLLQLRRVKMHSFNSVGAYERWFRKNHDVDGVEALEKQIIDVWTQFLEEYREVGEVETVLWTQFPLEIGGLKTAGVADFLGSFPTMASHPIVMLSLSHTWHHGISAGPRSAFSQTNSSTLATWTRWYDGLCTPRVCHCIELVCHTGYLILLVRYLLNPPNGPHTWDNCCDSLGWHELLLLFTPLSLVRGRYFFANAIPLLVSFAFLISLPSVPLPGSGAFTVLLWAFVLHILRLHLPCTPTPLFLLSHHRTLPLSSFLSRSLSRIIFPSVLFFLPMLLVSSFLLSISVADMFLKAFALPVDIPYPSPMETRLTFLYLFAVILVLLISAISLLATTLFSPSQENTDPWDRYSKEVGHMARMALVDAIAPYAGLYRFPPPFNIVHLLIRIPNSGARLLGIRTAWGVVAEKVLWRVIVGPLSVVFTILFWSLLQ